MLFVGVKSRALKTGENPRRSDGAFLTSFLVAELVRAEDIWPLIPAIGFKAAIYAEPFLVSREPDRPVHFHNLEFFGRQPVFNRLVPSPGRA
jgi:hypothetical protein